MKWERIVFLKKIQHPPSISKTNYTAHPHDLVHVPAKFWENTAMRFWVTVRKLNVTDGQTDRQTDGGVARSPVPGPTAPAGDNKWCPDTYHAPCLGWTPFVSVPSKVDLWLGWSLSASIVCMRVPLSGMSCLSLLYVKEPQLVGAISAVSELQ